MWTKPRFWYHVSQKNIGYKAYFEPREIYVAGESIRPRICVAPTVAHCLAAVSHKKDVYIYRTYRKVAARYPYSVCDSYITKERWLLDPTCFILQAKMNYGEIGLIESNSLRGSEAELAEQEKDYDFICRRLFESGIMEEYPHIDFLTKSKIKEIQVMYI